MDIKMTKQESSLLPTCCTLHPSKEKTSAALERVASASDASPTVVRNGRRPCRCRHVVNLAMLSLIHFGIRVSLSRAAAFQSTSWRTAMHPSKQHTLPAAHRHRPRGIQYKLSAPSSLFSFHSSHLPDSDLPHKKQRPDTKRHSHSPTASPLLNTAHQVKHIKVKHGKKGHSSSPQSAIDRLRVDLMRSQLSVSIAEQKANRLEAQLKEVTNNYRRAQQLLSERGHNLHSQRDNAVPSKTQSQLKTTAAVARGAVQTTSTLSTPFTGNSFDGLPPFAAALAANAEREEMQKRRRLGLIEEAEIDMEKGGTSGRADLNDASFNDMARYSSMPALERDAKAPEFYFLSGNQTNNIAVLTTEQPLSSLVDGKKNSTTASSNSLNDVASWLADTNYTDPYQTLNNSTINSINPQYTPMYNHDDIQTLRQKCILLTQQIDLLRQKLSQSESLRKAQHAELKSSIISERVLRGLQADWTRRLAEARKEMDGQKEEWRRELKNAEKEWQNEKVDLKNQIQHMTTERDKLTLQLENQKDIKFVIALFCDLATEHIFSTLRDGKTRIISSYSNSTSKIIGRIRYGEDFPPNRILTVGGAAKQAHKRSAIALLMSGVQQRLKSLKARFRKRPNKVYIAPDNLSIYVNETDGSASTATLSDNDTMPQLIRKNPRRSRLYHPESLFEYKISQRSTDADVPYFMRGA